MRLIDADALTKEVLGLRYTKEAQSVILTPAGQEIFNSGVEAASFAISDAPTIDAMPVVRCGDCWWYDSAFCVCSKCGVCVNRDFYCADAEKEG